MDRLPTWFVVGAVAVLVAVAAADALRPEPRAPEASAPTARERELGGLLVAAGADCSVRAVRLPDGAEEDVRRPIDCDGSVWSADHSLNASCANDFTTVAALDAGVILRLRGCSPAWRPDGAVSIIDEGDLYVARRRGRPQLFVSREELAQGLAGALSGGRNYRLVEVAWHGTVAFAGIVAGLKPGQQAVVYYTPEGLATVIPQRGQEIEGLRVSPLGDYLAFARNRAGREYVMVDLTGREIPLPQIGNVRAVAWSDDERWVALATPTATFVARTGSREVAARLELGGDTLEWLDSGPR
jgi:hypothetical protein